MEEGVVNDAKVEGAGAHHNVYSSDQSHHRQKRAKDDRKTCTLFLQSDTMLWDKMTKPKLKGSGYGYVSYGGDL